MEQFFLIALAHFLALLSPGPDFFLVARTSITAGGRVASGACLGIALANGVFIVAAFTGVTLLHPDSVLFLLLQLAGCAYLISIGVLFIRHAGASPLGLDSETSATHRRSGWWRAFGMGLASGLLNPKNALFYVSLASLVGGDQASVGWKLAYGSWMFMAVLVWDLAVALAIGHRRVLARFTTALPWLERASGVMLLLLAGGVLVHLAW
ncbi:LysE family translocator [Pseudomonas entomophila]|uniref:LysE family translocator n=1 Tax=Pseudomonas entomophila TaxID=312306 RepID=UPI0015E36765|nr:LysE family translocator [Pseudomonas entomophila]MBA1191254.1 LysE family translocator [Pseudomonas entomophila]